MNVYINNCCKDEVQFLMTHFLENGYNTNYKLIKCEKNPDYIDGEKNTNILISKCEFDKFNFEFLNKFKLVILVHSDEILVIESGNKEGSNNSRIYFKNHDINKFINDIEGYLF